MGRYKTSFGRYVEIPWFAVMTDRTDADCGYGSHNLEEAKYLAYMYVQLGHPDAYILVLDEENGGEAVDEITVDAQAHYEEIRVFAGLAV